MVSKMIRCNFRLRPEELKTIDLVASEQLLNRSEFIRNCLKKGIDEHLSKILEEIKQCN